MATRRRARRSRRIRRSGGGGSIVRRAAGRSGPSPQAVRNKMRVRTLALGGVTAAGFGLLQSKVELPSIKGIPDSLTYGVAGLAVGLLTNSDVLLSMATGPFMAGCHNIALKGFSDEVGGEFDDVAGDDESAGEFDDVAAGDFADV